MASARFWLSALRVPRTSSASPPACTTPRMKALDGRIFKRLVHQRNFSKADTGAELALAGPAISPAQVVGLKLPLLGGEGQLKVSFESVPRQHDVDRPFGEPATRHRPPLPQWIGARPVEIGQGPKP